jgi:hypothetical protein
MDITTQIHQYLTTAPSSHFRGQEVEILAHWEGHDHLLWRVATAGRGGEAVLKLYLDAGQARGRRQYDGQERFAPFGIAPRPLWFDRYPEGLSRQVLVYEWLPGDPLDLTDTAQTVALAQSVATVHHGDPSEVRRFCPHPVNLDYWWRVMRGGIPPIAGWLAERQADGLAQLFHQLATQTEALVTAALPLWQGVAPTPVHGDLQPENGLHSFGSAVLLDWEMFGLGDPALDVARLLQYSQPLLDAEGQTDWLEHYLAHFDQPGLRERIGVYGRVLPFGAISFLLEGLRTHLAEAGSTDALAQATPFLAETLRVTLHQALTGLQLTVDEGELAESIRTLLRK